MVMADEANIATFQFTHPGRGATEQQSNNKPTTTVSIHAPREGCDSIYMAGNELVKSFNSRTPGGVRL